MTGKIKSIVDDRGFGFIKPDDGGRDVFFHCTGLLNTNFDSLKVGDSVEFGVEDGEKGKRATNVKVL